MPQTRSLICAVITEETIPAARLAIQQAGRVADIIELRLDYLRDFDFTSPENLRTLIENNSLPVIITCRALSEGGRQHVPEQMRLRLLIEGARLWANYCDIEAASYEQAARLAPDTSRLIVSYHNFSETPDDLDKVYDRLAALPAEIIKIVTKANDVADTLAHFRLLDRAHGEGRKLIALSMGQPGLLTRLLGPARGSHLTYGSLGPGRESAAGQPRCEELRGLYRVQDISPETSITAIIGSPIGHSASPAMHNRAFAALGLNFVYLPIEVNDPASFFARFARNESREIDWKLRGFSVTIPHKSAVMALLDGIDATARRVGAANTVVVEDGKLVGYNTDIAGAIEPLSKVCEIAQESCGVIGAGGAARAVVCGLLDRHARVTVFARDLNRACALGDSFGVPVRPIESLSESDVTVLINATPVGMRGYAEGASPVARAALGNRRVAYDLVYNPIETRFLREAREEGCQTISGIEMLTWQAALQFQLWTGREAPVDLMRAAAIEACLTQAR